MYRILVPLALILCLNLCAQTKKMCITVDDLPTVPNGVPEYEFRLAITNDLLRTFERYTVPAIGYVNETKLYHNGVLDSAEVSLLEQWFLHGLELGNHTFSHVDYHRVSFETYTDDILRGEQVIKSLADKYNSKVRFFRHPYLRVGLRDTQADSLNDFLYHHGYTVAPVTIDNEDYLFALAYTRAYQKQDTTLMKRLGDDYVDYMEQKLLFFEGQSMKLFQRHMDQILLVHANLLNAHFMEDLIQMYKRHGYSFESQSEVLKDPAYAEEITKYGNWGISWLDRWALSRGKKGEFFAGDPTIPNYVQGLAE